MGRWLCRVAMATTIVAVSKWFLWIWWFDGSDGGSGTMMLMRAWIEVVDAVSKSEATTWLGLVSFGVKLLR